MKSGLLQCSRDPVVRKENRLESMQPMRTELGDGSLRLRTYRMEDVDALYEAVRESLAELSRWLPWAHADYFKEETHDWIASRPEAWGTEEYSFVIEDPISGTLLGGTALNHLQLAERRVNLGYWVRTRATGQGIATAATRLLAREAFEGLGLKRIEIIVASGNISSQRVAAKAGAVREGILRQRIRLGSEQRDAVCFSLIPSDLA